MRSADGMLSVLPDETIKLWVGLGPRCQVAKLPTFTVVDIRPFYDGGLLIRRAVQNRDFGRKMASLQPQICGEGGFESGPPGDQSH
jgi:hypothetical protein